MLTIDVTEHGPVFDGEADDILDEYLREAQWAIAQQALSDWHFNLDQSIRHPTPYYETQIHQFWDTNDVVVDDRGVIYGPWLEGTSPRNQTTQFKGYSSLRRAWQSTQQRATPLMEQIFSRYEGRLNG